MAVGRELPAPIAPSRVTENTACRLLFHAMLEMVD